MKQKTPEEVTARTDKGKALGGEGAVDPGGERDPGGEGSDDVDDDDCRGEDPPASPSLEASLVELQHHGQNMNRNWKHTRDLPFMGKGWGCPWGETKTRFLGSG